MLRKIETIRKTYLVNWLAYDVCHFLQEKSIKAEQLIQADKNKTNKLIRQLFLLACQASLSSGVVENKESVLLSNYAKSIKQISEDYQILFRRSAVSEKTGRAKQDSDSMTCSIDRLQARLFYLITQYSLHPCTHIAANIVEQLSCLCRHPHIELLPAQHYIFSQSINYWRSRLLQNAMPADGQELH